MPHHLHPKIDDEPRGPRGRVRQPVAVRGDVVVVEAGQRGEGGDGEDRGGVEGVGVDEEDGEGVGGEEEEVEG